MTDTVVIELNDSALGVARGDVVYPGEPGYALRDGDDIVLGADAQAKARATPQFVSNRYWDLLDQETLPDDSRWGRTPAEIAYTQLITLWDRFGKGADAAILVVPGTYTHKQLGLILGMCRKAGIPVVSLVDAAVAALAEPPAGAHCVYVDLTLHRVTATLCRIDELLQREANSEIDQLGLSNFQGKWAACVADACVRATRYDPMHSAQAEQELYDSLPDLLTALGDSDAVEHAIRVNDETQTVSVSRGALVQAVQSFYGRIVSLIDETSPGGEGALNVVLSDRLARFPDLAGELSSVKRWRVSALGPDAALRGVAAEPGVFASEGDSVGLIVERPVRGVAPAEAVAVSQAQPPTHILVDGEAYVLAGEPFVVGTATREGSWGYRATGAVRGVSRRHCSIQSEGQRVVIRDHSTYGTWVNGQRIDGERRLGAGDVVRVGNPGVELRLVREIVHDG